MRNRRHRLNNSGVALVTVLAITAVALALGYAALTISLSVLQGSKATESSVQARLNAESGLDAAFVLLEDYFSRDEDLEDVSFVIPNIVFGNNSSLQNTIDYSLSSTDYPQIIRGDTVVFAVDGKHRLNSTYTTTAEVLYRPAASGPPSYITDPDSFESQLYRGITSCSKLGVAGGGRIFGGGSILSKDNIVLTGGSAVEGDVYTRGSFTIGGGAKVEGNIFSKGLVTLNSATQYGSVFSEADIVLTNSPTTIHSMTANGNINFSGKESTVITDVYAGGFILGAGAATIKGNEAQGRGPLVSIDFNVCDTPPIQNSVDRLKKSLPDPFDEINGSPQHLISWEITPTSIIVEDTRWNANPPFIHLNAPPKEVEFLGNRLSIMRVKSMQTSDGTRFHITGGDVVLFVDDGVNFKTPDNIKIDSDSSLTIITPKQISFSYGGGPNTAWSLLNDYGNPSLTLISSFSSLTNSGFSAEGSAFVNAVVYVPQSKATIAAGSTLNGAIVANEVVVANDGEINFHNGLLDLIGDTNSPEGETNIVVLKRR